MKLHSFCADTDKLAVSSLSQVADLEFGSLYMKASVVIDIQFKASVLGFCICRIHVVEI